MRRILFLLIYLLSIVIISCEKSDEQNNNYTIVSEISIPTDSPRGLAYDGEYLWYSDDSLNCLINLFTS